MRYAMKVKQSDVSFGTALHWAEGSWSYGGKSLCGKPMRAIARDHEREYKRVCGSCAKIMAKRVENDHAEALRALTFQAGDTVLYIGTGDDDPDTVATVQSVRTDGSMIVRWDNGTVGEMFPGRLVHFTVTACPIEAARTEALALDTLRTVARAYLSIETGDVLDWDDIFLANEMRAEEIEAALATHNADGQV